jgi:hypothetical protein
MNAREGTEDRMSKKKEEGPRSFAVFLRQLAENRADAEISQELHDLVKLGRHESLARDAKVKGELSLKLKFDFAPNGVVGVTYEVKVKAPPKKTSSGHMFVTDGGNLSPKDERQLDLGLRDVSRNESDELRDVHDVAEAEE